MKTKTNLKINLIVITLLLMLCVFAFTACGGEPGDSFDTRPKLTLTTNIEGAGTVAGGGHFYYKEELFIKAEANNGYHFLGWYYDNELLSTDAEYYCTMRWNKNVTIEAQFTSSCRYKYNPENDLCVCELCGNSHTASELADDNGFVISSENELIAYAGNNPVVEIPDNVTRIGNSVFKDREDLTSVTIPNSVISIGSYAFSRCTGLTSLTIPENVSRLGIYAFNECRNLKEIYFNATAMSDLSPEHNAFLFAGHNYIDINGYGPGIKVIVGANVKKIPAYLFASENTYKLPLISSIRIPDSVENIGISAFKNCWYLTDITLPFVGNSKDGTNNTHFGYIFGATTYVENKDYVPASSVTIAGGNIDGHAFFECESIRILTIENGPTSIGDYAFSGCTRLSSVTIGNNVTTIGYYAFSNCTSLTRVTIGDSVTSIGDKAFCNCTNLTSMTIPDSVTNIGDKAFWNCTNLMSVTIGNGVTDIGTSAFSDCTGLTSVTIGNSVTSIGDNAFYFCNSLTRVYITDIAKWCNISFGSYYANPLYYAGNLYLNGNLVTELVIPDGVRGIEEYAFYGCTSLKSITIPNSVIRIYAYAFQNCTSLTSVTIGTGVISIGDKAFLNCSSLSSINYRGTKQQWNAISKGTAWISNTSLYPITYNYKEY